MYLLIFLLLVSHLAFDWLLQPPEMASKKRDLRSLAGYVHSFFNVVGIIIAVGSWALIMNVSLPMGTFALLLLFNFVTHLLIDAGKMNLVYKKEWKCNESKEFWWVTGIDQFLHLIILAAIAAILY